MGKTDIFALIHTIGLFSNQAIIEWNKSFPYKIGIAPILVLKELAEHGHQKQSDLANTLGLTPGAVTNIANKLIKEGYAQRQPDDTDRRIVYLIITGEGQKVLNCAEQMGQELRMKLFQILSDAEQKQLLKIYQKLLSNFE